VLLEHHVEVEEVAPKAAVEDGVHLGGQDASDVEMPVFDMRRQPPMTDQCGISATISASGSGMT